MPGQTEPVWAATLDAALALEPDHVSAYALTLDDPDAEGLTGPMGDHLPTTTGARRWRTAAIEEQDDDRAAAQYGLALERLAAAGFRGYEISNWARPGPRAGTTSPTGRAGRTRRWVPARTRSTARSAAGTPRGSTGTSARSRRPTVASRRCRRAAGTTAPTHRCPFGRLEATILGLRLDTGLALADAEGGPLAPHLAWALDAGLLEPFVGRGPRVRLTTRGRLLSNELFSRLV